jgi:Nuclease A inhibitor-like protein
MTPTALFPELSAPDLPIETMIITDFFEPVLNIEDWYGDEELEIVDRYADLLQTIDANLSEILVYRIGEIDIAIYIVGKTSDGDLVGLKTRSVET